jgi:hypothetical protein
MYLMTNHRTTLAENVSVGETAIDVADASAFPSAASFRVAVNDEIMTVTAVSGNTLTVTRGGSYSHDIGDEVQPVLDATQLENFDLYCNTWGVQITPPEGVMHWELTYNGDLFRYDGTAYQHMGQLLYAAEPDDLSGFSWVDQQTVALDQTHGNCHFTSGTYYSATSNDLWQLETNIASPKTYELWLNPSIYDRQISTAIVGGILIRDSALDYKHMFGISCSSSSYTLSLRLLSFNATNSTVETLYSAGIPAGGFHGLRLVADATNFTFYSARMPNIWVQIAQFAKTYHISGAVTIDKIGIGGYHAYSSATGFWQCDCLKVDF